MVSIETSFPRGGSTKQKVVKNESKNIIFGARQVKKYKQVQKNKDKIDEFHLEPSDSNIEAISAELLTYKTIQDGMIVMCYIEHITTTYLKVALPGRMTGKILASNISNSYSKILNKIINNDGNCNENQLKMSEYLPLHEIFHKGQKLYAKVLKIQSNDNTGKFDIELTLKPNDLHSDMNHKNIKKGMIFNYAIEEIQEHGYVIETGIKNLRCFLPLEKIENDKNKYSVGQLICVKIIKLVNQQSTATTVKCKEIIGYGNKRKIKDLIEPRIEYILPTMLVNFTVTKILKNGLQGTIMNGNFTAYCNEHHLSNKPSILPDCYELNSTYNAQILYIMPITKLVYVSLNVDDENNEDNNNNNGNNISYERGDVIKDVKVNCIGTGGIILKINDECKGLIPFKSIKSKTILNYDNDELLSKYHKNSKHKIRIIGYHPIESLFLCTDNPSEVNEKYYSLSDLNVGDYVTGFVEDKHRNIEEGGYFIKIGRVRGYIEKLYLSSSTKFLAHNTKIHCRVLAKDFLRNIVYLTNRTEYMSKNIKILTDYSQAKENRIYLGTIVKCGEKFIIVKFFNDIKGLLYKNRINSVSFASFYEGQTMNFRILSRDNEKIILSLIEDAHKLGEIYSGKIAHIIQDGLDVIIHNKNDNEDENMNDNDNDINKLRGLIPIHLISEFQELNALHLKNFQINDNINEMICLGKNIFSLRDVEYYKENPIKMWKNIKCGDILKGFIKNIYNNVIEIFIPIHGFNKLIKIHINMMLMNTNDDIKFQNDTNNFSTIFYPEQIVYTKILSKNQINKVKTITISGKLTDVWDGNFNDTAKIFVNYLNELKMIKKSFKKKNHIIHKLQIGEICLAKVIDYNNENDCYLLEIENFNCGIIKKTTLIKKQQKLEIGSEINCLILWIDYNNEIVYLSNDENSLKRIVKGKKLPKNLQYQIGLLAKILLITNDVIICSLKKENNPLFLIPKRLHYNDFLNSNAYCVKEGEFCRLAIIHDKYSIAVFENVWKLWTKIHKNCKRKNSEGNEKEIIGVSKMKKIKQNKDSEINNLNGNEYSSDENTSILKIKKSKEKNVDTSNKRLLETIDENSNIKSIKKIKENNKKILQNEKYEIDDEEELPNVVQSLPGPSNFWSNDLQTINGNEISSSDDDDDDEENSKLNDDKKKKNKKLTAAEKFQAAREEEARLREIEEKYANPNLIPETVDQFERLILSNPNDSKNWINYMVFHLQATEIEKAKIIGRKALKTISFREELELINIWIALLNLELCYGTKETFNEILKESLLCNDSYKIYTRVLHILSSAKKTQELIEIITICTKKFKDQMEMWKNAAIAYFEIGLNDKAKQLLHRALAVLPEREHINTIIAFANLNHKYGDKETSHALFEQILTSYPKRVDVWSQYVDILIKDQEFESVRRTLDRAIAQKIPLKKMRVLYKKYLDFEMKYGNEENVLKIKEMAANYIQKEINTGE